MVSPPIVMSALSPPPIRRACPPASTRPSVGGMLVVMHGGLAPVLRAFFLDVAEVLVEDDPVLPGERDEALAAGAPDQRQPRLARELHAPGSEAGARDENRDPHPHGLDHHLRGEAAG